MTTPTNGETPEAFAERITDAYDSAIGPDRGFGPTLDSLACVPIKAELAATKRRADLCDEAVGLLKRCVLIFGEYHKSACVNDTRTFLSKIGGQQ